MSFFGAAKPVEPKDIEVPNLPSDSTSALAWSPNADLLAVASWSNQVRIYQVNEQGQAQGKAEYTHEAPALCVQWSKVSFRETVGLLEGEGKGLEQVTHGRGC